MPSVVPIDRRTRFHGHPAAREAAGWVVVLARFGYAAKGVVYGVVGVLALLTALDGRGRNANTRGALGAVLGQHDGPLLLGGVALGLAAYALWRIVQAIKDTERRGTSIIGLSARLSYVVIGFVYGGLAYSALRLIGGRSAGADSDAKAVGWTARLMQQPLGPWLVAAVGLGVLVYGVAELRRGYKAEFLKKLQLSRMSPAVRTFATRCGQLGEAARGVVWVLIGGFLVAAAWHADPARARGLGGALRELGQQPYGPWLLGAVAAGLIVYGVFMLVLALYRRVALS